MKNPEAYLKEAVKESVDLKNRFFDENSGQILAFFHALEKVRETRKQVLIFGNGGSAADAQHFASELMHRVETRPIGVKAHALHTDTSLTTALGNDEGFQQVYARQIEMLADAADMAIAISTSGNSTNIVEALRKARERKCVTVGLLGRDGGKCKELCEIALIVPGKSTPRIQEVHGMIIHLVCQMLEKNT
jgi:D-sedoheptulose 7-phosphate isomerase